MSRSYRIGIVGASELLGKELGEALRERAFPTRGTVLLSPPAPTNGAEPGDTQARRLIEFEDEAAVVEPCSPAALEGLEAVFLATTPELARRTWPLIEAAGALAVDLSGGLDEVPGARLAGFGALGAGERQRPVVIAHPAAQALALLLERLQLTGGLQGCVATVFEPASQRGLAAIQELEEQSRSLLSLQPLPQAIFDAQVSFNLRAALGPAAAPGLAAVRQQIVRQLQALTEAATSPWPQPAVELLQAPVFHASVLSLYVRNHPPLTADALDRLLTSPWIERQADYPDVISAAGADRIQIGPPRADGAGGWWLFATLDNLRRLAYAAADAARAALEERA
ncbi:MAG: Asd/ArgC dimerization domain-containing protein [Terriglobales bacterium]